MVGADQHGVVAGELLFGPIDRAGACPSSVFAGRADLGDVRVVVVDGCAFGGEFFEKREAGRLALVADVRFVGEAEDEDTAAVDRFFVGIERLGDDFDDMVWHARVDFASQLDEACAKAVLARLPGEIEGIDRDAVPAQAGARVKRLVAERFGFGGIDDFPDVDVHRVVDDLEFVDEGDVDAAVDVFEQLGGFSGAAGRDGHDLLDGGGVESDCLFETLWGVTTNHLGDAADVAVGVAWVFTLGRKGEMKVFAGGKARASFEHVSQLGVGRAGVGGRLEDDKRASLQMGGDRFAGGEDVGDIGFAVLAERASARR